MDQDFVEINLGLSLDDAELESYVYSQKQNNQLIINIRNWQNKIIKVTFFNPLLFIDRFYGYTSKFGKKAKETDLLIQTLKESFKVFPKNHSFQLFQFLDLYDNPGLEIISEKFTFEII